MNAATYLLILNALDDTSLTIASLVKGVLSGGPSGARKNVLEESTQIAQTLYEYSPDVMRAWAFNLVTQCLQSEVVELTQTRHEFRFNVAQATSAYLEGSFMQNAARKMENYSPHLWSLMMCLLDANKLFSRRARKQDIGSEGVVEQLGRLDEIRCEELLDGGVGGDPEAMEEDPEGGHDHEGVGSKDHGAASRNALVQTIVSLESLYGIISVIFFMI